MSQRQVSFIKSQTEQMIHNHNQRAVRWFVEACWAWWVDDNDMHAHDCLEAMLVELSNMFYEQQRFARGGVR